MVFMFRLRAPSAKRLETIDVVAEIASARARRFRGALPGARAPLQVCKPRFGGYAWPGARRGAFANDFAASTASSGALDALNAFGANPRGARRAMDSKGDGQRDPSLGRRESARKARAGARETVMLVSEVLHVSGEEARARASTSRRFWPGVGELSLDKRLANLDTYPSAHT